MKNGNHDEINQLIMDALKEDGRTSNREIARRLGISESAVRQRLKKMQRAHQIRIGVVVDLNRTGRSVVAWIRIATALNRLAYVRDRLIEMEDATYVVTLSGQYNLLTIVTASDLPTMLQVVDSKIATLRGVLDVDARIIGRTLKHNFYEIAINRDARRSKA